MTTTTILTSPPLDAIREALPSCLVETAFPLGKKYQGKVRDVYDLGDKLMIISTDRQSAFDRVLAHVPYKGQVLNLISAWWFEKTQHIVQNHLMVIPDPNVMIVKKCRVFPVEFVMRGYITGTTNTSLWTQYNNGVRDYCGVHFKDGLKKNEYLGTPILTPTTKDKEHDEPISPDNIVARGLMSQAEWDKVSIIAQQLFHYGMEAAKEHGLILVDTKYEFGVDEAGGITLVDEVHTPDSSRYWLSASYEERIAQGLEPENIDKEFLRLWFAEHCDPYQDAILPKAPDDLIVVLASRYIELYERITGQPFMFAKNQMQAASRIMRNVAGWL